MEDNTEIQNQLINEIKQYDYSSTVAFVGSMFTIPSFQKFHSSINCLMHYISVYTDGSKTVDSKVVSSWFCRLKEIHPSMSEDAVNDVFISIVNSRFGSLKIIEGTTDLNDYNIQTVLGVISGSKAPEKIKTVLSSCLSLLKFSDAVINRLGLERWSYEDSYGFECLENLPNLNYLDLSKAITFSTKELIALDIQPDKLLPFIFDSKSKNGLLDQSLEVSDLSKFPILKECDKHILQIPQSVGYAIVQLVISKVNEFGYQIQFNSSLANLQFKQIHNACLQNLLAKSEYLELPEFEAGSLPYHSELFRYDYDKYFHVLFIHEDIQDCYAQGLGSYLQFSNETQRLIKKYINLVINHCKTFDDFRYGFTVLAFGGFGRGVILDLGKNNEDWSVTSVKIPDLLMISTDIDNAIDKYFKYKKQADFIKKHNVEVISDLGDLGHYCCWHVLKNQILPRDLFFKKPSFLSVDSGYVLPVRKRIRKLNDNHMISDAEGKYWSVSRLGKNTFFKDLANLPIYICDSYLSVAHWAGVVSTNTGVHYWLKISFGEKNKEHFLLIKDLFDGLLQLLHKLIYETKFSELNPELLVLEVVFDFSSINFDFNELARKPDDSEIVYKKTSQNKVHVAFPENFLTVFEGESDTGERKLFASLLIAILNLFDDKPDRNLVEQYLKRVFNKDGIKLLHQFHTYYEIDVLTNNADETKFLRHEDFVYNKIGMNQVVNIESMNFELVGMDACNDFLHSIVDNIWSDIKLILNTLDYKFLLEKLLRRYESIIHDRSIWDKTSKALLALYGNEESVLESARKRETKRSNTAISIRAIIEMGLCECKLMNGHKASDWIIDELLAKAMILIEVAVDSDSLHHKFASPEIHLHRNGEYDMDRSYNKTLVYPYMKSYHDVDFKKSAINYGELYKVSKPDGRKYLSDLYSDNFINAFEAEYQITPDEVLDCFGELMEIALKKNSVVVSTTVGEIRNEIISNKNISKDKFLSFLNFFAIFRRKNWDKPQTGCKPDDIAPWRFRRKLSMVSKPVLVCGKGDDADQVFYGVRTLQEGLRYVMSGCENGSLRPENFSSPEMISYIGRIKNIRGHEFAKQVGKKLKAAGWNVRCEVEMTELGGPSELGDVDVLAWNNNHEVIIIECKRLQFAKTIPEIAEVCKKFKGEAKDELRKHLDRVQFLRLNKENFKNVTGFIPEDSCISDKLVTNAIVPMQFLEDLPINSSKIGPLS